MTQRSQKWNILFVLTTSFLIHFAPTKCCVYEFITHPNKNLSCNPLGSKLQLHCAVSGPSSPAFTLHWYMGTREGNEADVLLDSMSDYSTMTGEMVVRSESDGQRKRTVSSVLRTIPILNSHRNQCLWCQVELEDMEVALYKDKHKFCFKDSNESSNLSPCEEVVVVANMQLSCITLDDVRVVRRASMKKTTKLSTIALSPTIDPSTSVVSTFELKINTMPSLLPSSDTVISLDASSALPLPTTSAVTVTETPSLTEIAAAPTKTTIPLTTSMKEELIAAVTICLVFILVIMILLGIIIALSRNRCNCCNMKKEEESNQTVENINPSVVQIQEATTVQKQTVQEDGADYDSLVIPAVDLEDIHGGNAVPAVISSPHHRQPTSVPLDLKKDSKSPRESHNFNFKSPPLPPPPHSAIYNHLSDYEDNHHRYQKCLNAEEGGSNMPPAAQQHTVSREHIYHTLECSSQVDCALVEAPVSPHTSCRGNQSESYAGSHGGRQVTVTGAHDYSEVLDLKKIEQMSPTAMSQQITDLFDEPRYAVMVVKGIRENEEEGLSGRREMWHSTPSLGSTSFTGSTRAERLSFRLPHAILEARESLIYS